MILRILLTLATVVAVGAALLAIVAAIRGRWSDARRAARVAMIATAIELIVPLPFGLAALVVSPSVTRPRDVGTVEPSERATALAQGISEWMNCTSIAILATLMTVPVRILARRHLGKGSSGPNGQ